MAGVTITVDEVVERARSLTDVEDQAPDHFLDNLTAVVDHLNSEAELSAAGVERIVRPLVVALRNRIEVDALVAAHPEVDQALIEAPIVVAGLPRSGTTYSQYLFDQDPRLRMLRTWEGERPVPPPALDAESVERRRAASAESARRAFEATGGKISAMHLNDVDGPQECLAILDQTCVNPGLMWSMSVPGYLEYLHNGADLRAAYEYHARVLRLLQHGAPVRRWALKWPCHLLALDAMAAVYPDAVFVATHRDPVQVLASNCSLASVVRAGSSPHADPHRIGRDMLDLIRRHVDGLMAFDAEQERLGTRRLVHVDYYRLAAAPATVMPELFAAVDLEWTPQVEALVREWRLENPKGKRGAHEYQLEDYGLDRETVTEAFGAYIDRFAIPTEADGIGA